MSEYGDDNGPSGEHRPRSHNSERPYGHEELPRGERQPLRLDTNVASSPQFQAISMVPTPLLPTGPALGFPSESESTASRTGRIVSTSLVPDNVSSLQTPVTGRIHQNLLSSPEHPQYPANYANDDECAGLPTPNVVSPKAAIVHRGNSLVIPKRGERSQVSLSRSASVGGPQRQPSTILHRERKATAPIVAELPEEVYLASTLAGAQTAWTRIKTVGKGSFSEVVLSRPASELVLPEFAEDVANITARELSQIEENIQPAQAESPKFLVAVKITRLSVGKTEAQLEFFRRDLDIMANLPHHPSLMKIIGSSLDTDLHKRAIFVLPYCPGGDLFDLVAKYRSKLSSLLIRRLFADVCSAVVFLHENLIVHRDIKLENVLLDACASTLLRMERPDLHNKPLAILTDLGLARKIDPQNPMLTTRCGSDDYVPPEIMLGQPYDGRETDSWALGVLLYAMLEGRLPFDAPPQIAQHDANRARLRTAHRIARVDWGWYKRREETQPEWKHGKEIVEACLTRRAHRALARNTLQVPWVAEALPAVVEDPHNVDDIWQIFVQ